MISKSDVEYYLKQGYTMEQIIDAMGATELELASMFESAEPVENDIETLLQKLEKKTFTKTELFELLNEVSNHLDAMSDKVSKDSLKMLEEYKKLGDDDREKMINVLSKIRPGDEPDTVKFMA